MISYKSLMEPRSAARRSSSCSLSMSMPGRPPRRWNPATANSCAPKMLKMNNKTMVMVRMSPSRARTRIEADLAPAREAQQGWPAASTAQPPVRRPWQRVRRLVSGLRSSSWTAPAWSVCVGLSSSLVPPWLAGLAVRRPAGGRVAVASTGADRAISGGAECQRRTSAQLPRVCVTGWPARVLVLRWVEPEASSSTGAWRRADRRV